jgi:hypothetical protein
MKGSWNCDTLKVEHQPRRANLAALNSVPPTDALAAMITALQISMDSALWTVNGLAVKQPTASGRAQTD